MSFQGGPKTYNVTTEYLGNGRSRSTISEDQSGIAMAFIAMVALGSFLLPIVVPLFLLWKFRSMVAFLVGIPISLLLLYGMILLTSNWNWLSLGPLPEIGSDFFPWVGLFFQMGVNVCVILIALGILYAISLMLKAIWRFFSSL